MTGTAPAPAYFDAARDAGALTRVAGARCVMGAATDSLNGEHSCLVEYADPQALARSGWAAELLAHAMRVHPTVHGVLLRTEPGVELPAPWTRHLTYLRHDGPPEDHRTDPDAGDVTIAAATTDQTALVLGWLADAFQAGARDQGIDVGRDTAHDHASQLLAVPGRHSLVAATAGQPVGHATMLPFTDDVTGTEYTELFDVLVRPTADVRTITAALVDACLAHVARTGLPLLGNVIHQRVTAGASDRGDRVVASLLKKGWRTEHCYWRAPAGPPANATTPPPPPDREPT
ncbi:MULTISPECIES: GNAT family N-acetyltransferase [Streptomyces]|uniref:N-acetyltransferase domain-containing protein n=1 Tax=Streptomyces canarius TaxID=285453 RepID=A0ABQ3D395_9ACTN|nr:GNAT family N-acetyltransferase [Streptomyces canarius]GHA54426.1 hypothetical protein GCM10010345_68830 [Streptomyces canarius]